jgi:hypothetical protein
MKLKRYLYFSVGLLMLLSGCTKRYWYRVKIDVPRSNKYSVQINIVNENKELISHAYEEAMHQAAAKALRKMGFYETRVKEPTYNYTLTLRIDTFNQEKRYFDHKNVPETTSIIMGNYNHQHGVAAIVFFARLDHKNSGTQWSKYYDIYFFGEKRDIQRGKGVVKFLIRTSNERTFYY